MDNSENNESWNRASNELRRAHEIAELHIAVVNAIVRQMSLLRYLSDQIVLGEIFHQEPQDNDGFNVHMAVLSMAAGVGATVFDADELFDVMSQPMELENAARTRFKGFLELSPICQLALHRVTDDLMCRLFKRLPHLIEKSI